MIMYTVAVFHIKGKIIPCSKDTMSFVLGIISLCLCLLFHVTYDHLLEVGTIRHVELTKK